jgi:hypothetical protein
MIQELVDRCEGNQTSTARRIGVSRAWVNRILTGRGGSVDACRDTWNSLLRAVGPDAARDSRDLRRAPVHPVAGRQ